jgi:hypothetical protein
MTRRHILPLALAAAAAAPATAIAQDETTELQKVRQQLDATLAGNVVTVTPKVANDTLVVKTSRKGLLDVELDQDAGTATFDLLGVTGETFELQREKRKRGQVQFRLVATFTREGQEVTRRFNVVVKSLVPAPVEQDDDAGEDAPKPPKTDRESKGRGRGPETEAQREARREAGEGRGPETAAEREARTDRDDD